MGHIVTFYSYKGGVGRSMALANVALLLARRGLRVLVVDWDLEAPGLERYFGHFAIGSGGTGLLRLCMQARDTGKADWAGAVCTIESGTAHPITLLASGREADDGYPHHLEHFDWSDFFERRGGGAFIERLRTAWRESFDVVLIDSRTGLSDTGGICTIQLPDIVVAMFTANTQSLYGARDVMRLAQQARQRLAYDRMPLTVLPLPARWGMQEFKETQLWLTRVADTVQELVDDWLPRPLRALDVVQGLKVPQRDYFGFGEKLAVVEEGSADPGSMGYVYERVAAFIASDFADIGALLGPEALARVRGHRAPAAGFGVSAAAALEGTARPAEPVDDYEHDIYLSHEGSLTDWALEFIDSLRLELQMLLPRDPRIFVDLTEVRLGSEWHPRLQQALLRSRLLVALVTPRYLRQPQAMAEFQTFSERSVRSGLSLVLPLQVRGESLPDALHPWMSFDFRELGSQGAGPRSAPWRRRLRALAERISLTLDTVPAFDGSWRVAALPSMPSPVAQQRGSARASE